jgi:hypothetical protein
MTGLTSLVLALGVLLTPALLKAAVFQRDWKTPGDGLLTYDDVNKREWLDLPLTRLSLFPGSNREERYERILSETANGGMFAGFMPAQSEDVIALAHSAGINTDPRISTVNEGPVSHLIQLLGPTAGAPPESASSQGFLSEFRPSTSTRRLAALVVYRPPNTANLFIAASDDSLVYPELNAVWLYRPIPEPHPLVLLLAVASLAPSLARARKKRGNG